MKINKMCFGLIFCIILFTACTRDNTSTLDGIKSTVVDNITTVNSIDGLIITNENTNENGIGTTGSVIQNDNSEKNFDKKICADNISKLVYSKLKSGNWDVVPVDTDMAVLMDKLYMDFKADMIITESSKGGKPLLLIGSHGMTGSGIYDVCTIDGVYLGNVNASENCKNYIVTNDSVYVLSGSADWLRCTKLDIEFPTIYCDGCFISQTEPMDVVYEIGKEQERFEQITYDTLNTLYLEKLGVQFEDLNEACFENTTNLTCAQAKATWGVLNVPDPQNYTEEDIYNCILDLLTKYEELAAEQ